MSLIVSGKGGGDFELHPVGPFAARCVRIIDLGTHDGEYQGKPKKTHKIRFVWETSEKMTEGEMAGKPFLVTQNFTASLSDRAKLKPFLESWRGRPFTKQEIEGFDLKNVLGKACMLNMVHSQPNAQNKVYANIGAVMPLPAGMTAPTTVTEQIFFSLEDFNAQVYNNLPDKTRELIAQSDEYKAMFGKSSAPATQSGGSKPAIDDDDIPF